MLGFSFKMVDFSFKMWWILALKCWNLEPERASVQNQARTY